MIWLYIALFALMALVGTAGFVRTRSQRNREFATLRDTGYRAKVASSQHRRAGFGGGRGVVVQDTLFEQASSTSDASKEVNRRFEARLALFILLSIAGYLSLAIGLMFELAAILHGNTR